MQPADGKYRLKPDAGIRSSLRAAAVDGILATFGSRIALTVIQLVSTIILARLLTPDDFGLVGMIVPVAALLGLFADAGLSSSTIQAKGMTHEQASGLFWANVALGFVSSVVLGAGGPLMAAFYDRPEIAVIAPAYAGSLLISSFSTQHLALLRRQMAFRQVAFIGVAATLASAALAAVLAWRGASYWALVAMAYANALVSLALAWYALRWIPGLPIRGVGLRKMMRFGGYVAGGNLLYLVSENVVPIVLGRMSGAAAVGLFGRAKRLADQFIDQVTAPLSAVAPSVLSRLQDDLPRLKTAVREMIEKVTVFTFALAGVLLVSGADIVVLLLGARWREAGAAVQLLALGALMWPVSRILASAMVGLGHSRPMFTWSWMSLAIRLAAVVVGAGWGLVGVAAAVAASQWAGLVIFSLFITKYLPVSMGDILRWVRPTAFAAAIAIAGTAVVIAVARIGDVPLRLVLSVVVFVSLYIIGHVATKAGRRVVREALELTRLTLLRRSDR